MLHAEFWLADKPAGRVSGVLDESRQEVRCDHHLVECAHEFGGLLAHVVVGETSATTPQPSRARGEDGEGAQPNDELLLHGVLSDGTRVSLLGALTGPCSHQGPWSQVEHAPQAFRYLTLLRGGHVGPEEAYEGLRVTFDTPWARSPAVFPSGEIALLEDVRIRVEATSGALQFARLPGLQLLEIQQRVLTPVQSLLMLLTGRPIGVESLILRSVSGGDLAVGQQEGGVPNVSREIITRVSTIGITGLNSWYKLSADLAPIPTVVAKSTVAAPLTDVETRVLTLATAAEALHRELYQDDDFPDRPTKSEAKRIVEAAKQAAPARYAEMVGKALADVRRVTYVQRLSLLVYRLGALGDDVAGYAGSEPPAPAPSVSERAPAAPLTGRALWLEEVKNARNDFAHLNTRSVDDLRRYASESFVRYESLRWAVTAVMLLHVGLPLEQVRTGIHGMSSYRLFHRRAKLHRPDIYNPADA